jgi:hypothetical protein
VIHNLCGTNVPAEIGAVVTHMAECPDTPHDVAQMCRGIVSAVSRAAAVETPAVSPETPAPSSETAPVSPETPDETPRDAEALTDARLSELRDSRMSLRDLGALAGVAPETVRRRVAKYRAGQVGAS